jgi:hypothetical protein
MKRKKQNNKSRYLSNAAKSNKSFKKNRKQINKKFLQEFPHRNQSLRNNFKNKEIF